MRKLTILLAGMTLAISALPAAAGVVITEKQHTTSGSSTRDSEQTVFVQGNKQKMETENRTSIIDLDKGKAYVIDPKAKTYFEMDFPPTGQMGAMMAASHSAARNFKKADTTREIAGYKCTDYNAGGHVMQGDYTVKACFSTAAPGADEYAAFEKNMAAKLKSAFPSAAAAGTGEVPPGVPLALDSTMKMTHAVPPGLPPDQAKKLTEMMAKRPPTLTSTLVEKIESKTLTDADFEIPAGFTKITMPTGPIRMSTPPKAPGAAASAGAPTAGAPPAAH